ncbi:MAG: hypothetical protein HY744_21890 [Deltaproteobacteria bacterium]|nr:hypothetical protein [Deltaproteobacteria bacterium]
MGTWQEDLVEAVKSTAEREAEDEERRRKRVAEGLEVGQAALRQGAEALRFAAEKLRDKGLTPELEEKPDETRLAFRDLGVRLWLERESAVVKVVLGEGKPREFDFAKDRHLAPKDVEEYVGRRAVELVRTTRRSAPW